MAEAKEMCRENKVVEIISVLMSTIAQKFEDIGTHQ